MTRRELLGLLLCLPWLGCARGPGHPFEGSLVGPSRELGHLLRKSRGARPGHWQIVPVVIAGGGVAGLAAAWTFERAGFSDYALLELEPSAGGTARSGSNDVSAYPWGAHYVPTPPARNRSLVRLLDEVGAVEEWDDQGRPVWAEHVLCRAPQERLHFGGSWQEDLFPAIGARAEDRAQLEEFADEMRRWAAWRDDAGRPAFAIPRATGSDADEVRALDRESMASYLDRHGWTSPRLHWWVEYGCRDDFGSNLEQTSAWAGVHYHASRMSSADGEEAELLAWPEGNGRLVHHLVSVAGSRIRTGALVTDVAPATDSVDVTWVDADSHDVLGVRAEHAVVALPRYVAGRVVVPWREDPPAHIAGSVYGSWVVANLTLRDRPREPGFPLAWDNVIHDSPSLGYVVATHQAGRDHGPTVLTWYRPFPEDDVAGVRRSLERTGWRHWADQAMNDLRLVHPEIDDLVERVDVMLWAHAMVRPRPGYLWSPELAAAAEPLGRVHFAHTDLSGLALFEEAWYWGIRAAEAVLSERGHPHESWLS